MASSGLQGRLSISLLPARFKCQGSEAISSGKAGRTVGKWPGRDREEIAPEPSFLADVTTESRQRQWSSQR